MAKSVPANDFTVGWVCALPIEMAAAAEMMDEEFADLPSQPSDTNIYSFGRIGVHNVVVACLPAGQMGTNQAATVASQMRTSFPLLRFGVLVGIGGGVPNLDDDIDIRLGDVVISQPSGQHGGVIQYDFGKTGADGRVARTGSLNAPPTILLNALAKLRSNDLRRKTQVLNQELGGVLCFEMEAAGLMNNFPCIDIRGICDCADVHKNKRWQAYAAATAAAYVKELLCTILRLASSDPDKLESSVDMAMFENAYCAIGRALDVRGINDDDQADVKGLVKTALERDDVGSWLFIVDNADDTELLFTSSKLITYLPSNRKGSILLTTRNH
ncbi:phosphorylase superfamily protein [Colletotrichum salicis]|uniref:Phosphorylase superfamily protein n=1 Tax=Colletotrichum salicis TaxID=1209931 RepID=A0A135T6W2_9PEZI|nr:phosphorylase superfamily protein [Colletotrichum salicis]